MLENPVDTPCFSKERFSKPVNTQNSKFRARVLLVEDQRIVRKVNCSFLQLLNCQVEVACDGKEALSMMCCEYDLIFLDIGLPDMKGTAVCRQIRSKKGQHLPIIALTACDVFKEECYEAGCNEFVLKPIALPAFRRLLDKWL